MVPIHCCNPCSKQQMMRRVPAERSGQFHRTFILNDLLEFGTMNTRWFVSDQGSIKITSQDESIVIKLLNLIWILMILKSLWRCNFFFTAHIWIEFFYISQPNFAEFHHLYGYLWYLEWNQALIRTKSEEMFNAKFSQSWETFCVNARALSDRRADWLTARSSLRGHLGKIT